MNTILEAFGMGNATKKHKDNIKKFEEMTAQVRAVVDHYTEEIDK